MSTFLGTIRIGINGFGRIGRIICRQCIEQNIFVAAINDPKCTKEYLASILTHDSVHGKPGYTCEVTTDGVMVGENLIKVFNETEPHLIPWSTASVNIVMECTGKLTLKADAAQHFGKSKTDESTNIPETTVKKVIIAAPSADADTFIYGINSANYTSTMNVISGSSSVMNCVLPIINVLNQNWGISKLFITTIESVAPTQPILDDLYTNDWCYGRSGLSNIIPTKSLEGINVISSIYTTLGNKVAGFEYHVPVANVSVATITAYTNNVINLDAIKTAFLQASNPTNGSLKDLINYVDDNLVSSDYKGNAFPCNLDINSTYCHETDTKLASFTAFFDNEWAYASQLIKLAILLESKPDF